MYLLVFFYFYLVLYSLLCMCCGGCKYQSVRGSCYTTDCGGGVLDHELLEAGFPTGTKLTSQLKTEDKVNQIHTALIKAQSVVSDWGRRQSEVGVMQPQRFPL